MLQQPAQQDYRCGVLGSVEVKGLLCCIQQCKEQQLTSDRLHPCGKYINKRVDS
jgi:hypothetical protein